MAALINAKELEKILLALLEKMQKQGIALSVKDKDALIKTVTEKILSVRKDLSTDDVKNVQMQKLFRVAILSQHLENTSPDKKLHFDFAKLFDKKLTLNLTPKKMDEMQKKLELTLTFLLKKLNDLQPPNKKMSLDDILKCAKKLSNDFINKLSPQELSLRDTADTLDTQLDAAMRSLFGGMKPGIAGSIPMVVYQVAGNLYGIADQQGGNEQSLSFMDESNRYDGKADYVGVENENFQRMVSLDGQEVDSILRRREEAEATQSSTHTPFKTKPAPPGTHE